MRLKEFIENYYKRILYLKNNPTAPDALKQKILDQIIYDLKSLPEKEVLTGDGHFNVTNGINKFISSTVRVKAEDEVVKNPGLKEEELVPMVAPVVVQTAAYAPPIAAGDDYHTFPPHSNDERDEPESSCCGCFVSWW